ncbi:MAG: DMT family transporter [Microbacteriaceae bacterium]
MTAARRGLPLAAIGISVVLWSTAFALSNIVLQTGSPAVLSVARFLIALVVLVPFAARRRGFAATLRAPRTVVLGLTGVTFYYSLTNIGLLFTSPGTVALSNALLPVLTTVLAVVILRERPRARTIVGLILATAGVVLVAAAGLSFEGGIVLVALGLASYSLYTVLLKQDADRAGSSDALVLATATAVWGTVLMLPWLLVEVLTGIAAVPSGWPGIGSLLFLGLVVSAPTLVLWNYGAERLPATISGIAIAGIPALGYAFAVLLGETPVPVKVVGGVIALAGIVIATLASPRIEPSPPGSAVMSEPRSDAEPS